MRGGWGGGGAIALLQLAAISPKPRIVLSRETKHFPVGAKTDDEGVTGSSDFKGLVPTHPRA